MDQAVVPLLLVRHTSKSFHLWVCHMNSRLNDSSTCFCFSSTNYLRAFTNDMNKLRIKVQHIIWQSYPYLAPFLKEDFNHVQFSINGSKGVKHVKNTAATIQTGFHTDVTYSFSKERGIHCKETMNSQVPNSLVAILTVGHPRILTMERVHWNNGVTNEVLETRHFILSHGSLFILHCTDERPSRRDGIKNEILSYWRHGDVKHACSNPNCTYRCNAQCTALNEHTVSFAVAFRTCGHTRMIERNSNLDPLLDGERKELNLDPLNDTEKDKNINAAEMLAAYNTDGRADNFNNWLKTATKKVLKEFYGKE